MRLTTILFMLIVLATAGFVGVTCFTAVSACSERLTCALQVVEG
jgi:hypothetical protein